jgi:hypothetical protein
MGFIEASWFLTPTDFLLIIASISRMSAGRLGWVRLIKILILSREVKRYSITLFRGLEKISVIAAPNFIFLAEQQFTAGHAFEKAVGLPPVSVLIQLENSG